DMWLAIFGVGAHQTSHKYFGSDKYISGTALYRIDNDVDAFREITFKDCFNPNYTASVVQGSYCPDNEGGRESFILTRRLYNGVTNNKHVPSNVIVSYANENNWYNAIKNNLQKTVLSVIGRLKIGSSRVPYIVASDIEWTYLTNESQSSSSSSKEKSRSREELDTQLDNIEKKYATLFSQPLQKKPKLSLHSTSAKKSNNSSVSVNFLNIVSQVCLNEHPPKCNDMNPMPQTTEQNNLSDTSTCTIPFSNTKNDVNTCTNNCDPIISVSTTLPLSRDKNTKQAKKGLRPLLPLKK
ncbi:34141_t:CDS:2, partial [Gigaspora margarita]